MRAKLRGMGKTNYEKKEICGYFYPRVIIEWNCRQELARLISETAGEQRSLYFFSDSFFINVNRLLVLSSDEIVLSKAPVPVECPTL